MKTRSGKVTGAKVDVESAPEPPKPKSSKIQKINRPEQTEGTGKSVKQKGRTRKAKGAGAGKQSVKKKAEIGSKDESVLPSIEDTGADAILDLTTVPQPSKSSIRRGARPEFTRSSPEQAVLDLRAWELLVNIADEDRKAAAANETSGGTPIRNDEPASTHGQLERPAVEADHVDNGVSLPTAVHDKPASDPFRDITREALHLAGWDTAPLQKKKLRACCVEPLARLPSPMAVIGKHEADLKALIKACVHSGVRHSYELLMENSLFLKEKLTGIDALSDGRLNGIFCALASRDARPRDNVKGKGKARDMESLPVEFYCLDPGTDKIHIPMYVLSVL